jgi:hypothetical protein
VWWLPPLFLKCQLRVPFVKCPDRVSNQGSIGYSCLLYSCLLYSVPLEDGPEGPNYVVVDNKDPNTKKSLCRRRHMLTEFWICVDETAVACYSDTVSTGSSRDHHLWCDDGRDHSLQMYQGHSPYDFHYKAFKETHSNITSDAKLWFQS